MGDPIQQLITQLGGTIRERRRAVSQLIHIGTPTVEALMAALEQSPDVSVQLTLMRILGKIGDERAVPQLAKLLSDENYYVHSAAATALVQLGALDSIRATLQEEHPGARKTAAEAIGKYGREADAALLIPLLDDSDPDVRRAAAYALSRFDSLDAIDALCQKQFFLDKSTQSAALDALIKYDDDRLYPTLDKILAYADAKLRKSILFEFQFKPRNDARAIQFRLLMLRDNDASVREKAAYGLQWVKQPPLAVGKALVEALGDSSWEVRRQAASSLDTLSRWRGLRYLESFDALVLALKDKNKSVRAKAAHALGSLKDKRAIPYIIPLLKDREESVRNGAADGLSLLGGTEAVQPLLEAIRRFGGDWYITRALAQLGDGDVVEPLMGLLKSRNVAVIEAAADTLRQICDERATTPLIELLSHRNAKVREAAANALSMIRNRDAVNALVGMIDDKSYPISHCVFGVLYLLEDKEQALRLYIKGYNERKIRQLWPAYTIIAGIGRIGGSQAVSALIDILFDEVNDLRYLAAEELGRIGDGRAIEPLIWALRESELKHVRVDTSAAQALGRMRAVQAVPALLESLQEAYDNDDWMALEAIAQALGKIGDGRALQPVINLLAFANPLVRIAAAYDLRKLGDGRATEALIPLLDDTSPMVRQAAVAALGTIGDARATEALIASLNEDNDQVFRTLAMEALSRIGDKKATDIFIKALYDDRNRVRKTAARGLVRIGLDALPQLMQVDIDDEKGVPGNRRLVWVLGELGDEKASPKLISVVEHTQDLRTRGYAIHALGKIKSVQGLGCIVQAAKDRSPYLRASAATALAELGQPQTAELLNALTQDSDTNVRRAAIRGLEILGNN